MRRRRRHSLSYSRFVARVRVRVRVRVVPGARASVEFRMKHIQTNQLSRNTKFIVTNLTIAYSNTETSLCRFQTQPRIARKCSRWRGSKPKSA